MLCNIIFIAVSSQYCVGNQYYGMAKIKDGCQFSYLFQIHQPKGIQFTVCKQTEEKQKIFTFEKLEPNNFDFPALKMTHGE